MSLLEMEYGYYILIGDHIDKLALPFLKRLDENFPLQEN